MEIAQLLDEHDMLSALADELEAACAAPQPEDLAPVCLILDRFTQLLEIHLLREDAVLYPRLVVSPDPEIAGTATRFEHEVGHLHTLVQDFDTTWPVSRINNDWSGFAKELAEVLATLRTRIDREDNELYPLLREQNALA